MQETNFNKVILLILDGFGYSKEEKYNAIRQANMQTFNYLWQHYPQSLLAASGNAVGLPSGQIGNSEVGHMVIGAGRIIPQSISRINDTLEQNKLAQDKKFIQIIQQSENKNNALHLIGLVSNGGVHSHMQHIMHIIQLAIKNGHSRIYLHAILDGRDTPPRSASKYLQPFIELQQQYKAFKIITICGRYYAMDRDNNWQRTQKAYEAIVNNQANFHDNNVITALQNAYQRQENDEFIQPTILSKISINAEDNIIFLNFRTDRIKQLFASICQSNFSYFSRVNFIKSPKSITMTDYQIPHVDYNHILFPQQTINNTLSELIAAQNYKQLHIAETEKYAHVTYFFNGGRKNKFIHEDRVLLPSKKIKNHAQYPAMQANKIANYLIDCINNKNYAFIVANIANPDMVGHSGDLKATIQAMHTVDNCLKNIYSSCKKNNTTLIITADHGNAELMFDEKTGQPHTAHTLNEVPFLLISDKKFTLHNTGSLADIAPTILQLLNLKIPDEMSGISLIK